MSIGSPRYIEHVDEGGLLCVCITGAWDGVALSNVTADRLTWRGTVRMRWQGDFQNGTWARNVLQYGLRLDTTLRASDRIDIVGRLMTGNPRAIVTSEWVKAGDFLMNKNSHISWLYAQVRPVPSVTLTGGKFTMPFFKPTSVVLDPDLSAEPGLAYKHCIWARMPHSPLSATSITPRRIRTASVFSPVVISWRI